MLPWELVRIGASFARVLWAILLAACGRIGFDNPVDDGGSGAPAASVQAELDLTIECGDIAPPAQALAITNTGDADLVIASAMPSPGFSVTTALPLTIPAGQTASLAVAPPMAVIGTDLAGAIKAGQLEIATNDATGSYTIALSAKVMGANIGFLDGNGQQVTAYVFTGTSGACPAPATFELANTGDEDASAVLSGNSAVLVVNPPPTISAGSAESFVLRPQAAGACSSSGGFVQYVITGPVCTDTPVVLAVDYDITGSSSCFCS